TLVRAFMESVGYALRANMEQIVAVTNEPAAALTLSGGMSRSAALTRAIADILGVPALVAQEAESAALGCAMLVMASAMRTDLSSAVARMLQHRRLDPDPAQHERYAAPYAKWRQLYDQFDDLEIQ